MDWKRKGWSGNGEKGCATVLRLPPVSSLLLHTFVQAAGLPIQGAGAVEQGWSVCGTSGMWTISKELHKQ